MLGLGNILGFNLLGSSESSNIYEDLTNSYQYSVAQQQAARNTLYNNIQASDNQFFAQYQNAASLQSLNSYSSQLMNQALPVEVSSPQVYKPINKLRFKHSKYYDGFPTTTPKQFGLRD